MGGHDTHDIPKLVQFTGFERRCHPKGIVAQQPERLRACPRRRLVVYLDWEKQIERGLMARLACDNLDLEHLWVQPITCHSELDNSRLRKRRKNSVSRRDVPDFRNALLSQE
jgi:hypothetical protein